MRRHKLLVAVTDTEGAVTAAPSNFSEGNSTLPQLWPTTLTDEYLMEIKERHGDLSFFRNLYMQEFPLPDRGSGRTSRQIVALDKRAYFITLGGAVRYTRALCRFLAREDVRVLSIDDVYPDRILSDRAEVAVDHAVWTTLRSEDRRVRVLDEIMAMLEQRDRHRPRR